MRAIAFAVLFATVATAEEKPKAASLTPKEIAEGWVLLFDGETTFGWAGDHDKNAIKKGLLGMGSQLEFMILPAGKSESVYVVKGVDEPNSVTHDTAHLYALTDVSTALRSMKWQPSGLKPIFNGKDLAGWKLFEGDAKRKASKFEVTKDGELRVTNGPGDLQTEKQYADFLLQFDCKTNGTALNSGIFFRCRANEYQNGYEAQIQNAFKDNDRTKPADFGTGAIYRRIAARKVVSNDNEWFTMTVLAVGPNIRTWVNGYPVVNWTDERKATDNARTGLYLKPGHLSIQGHDPTTDILFRNIKVVEIKN